MDFLKAVLGRFWTWVSALGVGAVVALYDYFTAAKAAADASSGNGVDAIIHGAVLAVLVKVIGALVNKLPSYNP